MSVLDRECSLCGERFGDGACFCLHRVGLPGLRRCLEAEELLLLGCRLGSRGVWFREDRNLAWLFWLNRTEYGFSCDWPRREPYGDAGEAMPVSYSENFERWHEARLSGV
jgi:hypothetical protein